jgi:hypothetical protein
MLESPTASVVHTSDNEVRGPQLLNVKLRLGPGRPVGLVEGIAGCLNVNVRDLDRAQRKQGRRLLSNYCSMTRLLLGVA